MFTTLSLPPATPSPQGGADAIQDVSPTNTMHPRNPFPREREPQAIAGMSPFQHLPAAFHPRPVRGRLAMTAMVTQELLPAAATPARAAVRAIYTPSPSGAVSAPLSSPQGAGRRPETPCHPSPGCLRPTSLTAMQHSGDDRTARRRCRWS